MGDPDKSTNYFRYFLYANFIIQVDCGFSTFIDWASKTPNYCQNMQVMCFYFFFFTGND
jgi:hypothetical protein